MFNPPHTGIAIIWRLVDWSAEGEWWGGGGQVDWPLPLALYRYRHLESDQSLPASGQVVTPPPTNAYSLHKRQYPGRVAVGLKCRNWGSPWERHVLSHCFPYYINRMDQTVRYSPKNSGIRKHESKHTAVLPSDGTQASSVKIKLPHIGSANPLSL